jgi:inhibitor of cysteine peptidase
MACEKLWTPKCLDTNVDNQLINLDNSWSAVDLKVNFKMQNFSSCQNMEDVVKNYILDYSKLHPWYTRGWWIMYDGISSPQVMEKWLTNNIAWAPADTTTSKPVSADNYSQTNIQVAWVDESEIVKTDGKYIYFYNETRHSIIVSNAFPATELKIVKEINVPLTFGNPEIYINWKKLIIVASKYVNMDYGYYWFNRASKTVVVSYDMTDINKLRVEKYFQIDGNITKTRRIGKYVYVLSQSNFDFPYQNYYWVMSKASPQIVDEQKLNADFDPKKILPKKAELEYTLDTKQQNVVVRWKNLPYSLTQDFASKCTDIEFVMPDKDTMSKFDFTPSFVTLSIINTEDPSEDVKTKVLFWDVNEVYMSLDNLYVTSNLYTSYNFKCPQIMCIKAPCPQPDCFMPVYNSWENTLVHKISISGNTAKYVDSTILPWTPLNQYSMDQAWDWAFRIVTTSYSPDHSTNVFVLDKNLNVTWKITWIAKNENFQSSRFIWNKLYLVTFQQIDPLFVIDLANNANPKIVWELKIPGYSTYLHPYDETHLIWLGYNTQDSWHWWVMNWWLKVDLYDIADINNPKQQYSLTLWDQGSSSDVLQNPKLFVWNAAEKTLLMPVTLFTSANDANNPYRHSDAFQGSVAIKIDKDSWIKELARVSHIDKTGLEEKRKQDCAQYVVKAKPQCQILLNGQEYCPPANDYVPEYCYASSTAWEYFANQIWQYSSDFIIRNLYLNNFWYTFSNSKIQANDTLDSYKEVSEISFK